MKINIKNKILFILLIFFISVSIYFFLKPSHTTSKSTYVLACVENDGICITTKFPYQDSSLSNDLRVTDLIGRMTNAEKIGQMALIEKNSISDVHDITKYGLGALLSGGGGKPDDNSQKGWLLMVSNFQSYSKKTRLGIPLFYGIDAVHGNGNVPGATIFPHFIGLGASRDPNLVKAVARATAEEVAATGINWNYSPNLDVAQDIRWGRTYETFSSDPQLVALLGYAYIEGLQTDTGMAATAKHYIGNGSMKWGSSINDGYHIDQGDSVITEEELRQIHLPPFKQAIRAGVKSVMIGLNKWNGEKVSTNKYLLTDILRTELGFQGFVVSDWYAVHDTYEDLVKSVNAGIDMIMLPYDYKFFSDNMHTALANGDITQERLDEAARRILKVKFEIGLFDQTTTSTKNISSQAHRDLARTAVRKSLVLLKNDNALPLSKKTRTILVSGSAANNLGKQSGGWTVEWQGIDGNLIPGTTILQSIQDAASPYTKVTYELNGDFIDQTGLADVGIAVVGENPYAEGVGDSLDPKLSADDLKTISNLKKFSKKIIVIIISGRPLDIVQYINNWDAVIAAWLPGSEGQGVADVLFGDYEFTGTLPVKWEINSSF